MQVIGLCGYAGSGKDTAAEALVEIGWKRAAFADPIREMALAIDPIVSVRSGMSLSWIVNREGWEQAKQHPEVRRLLQRIGTEAGRNILGYEVWVIIARNRIAAAEDADCPGVVITDLRFANEYEHLHKYWGAKFVRISRPGIGPVNDHESDQHLAGFEVDHEIVNDGDKAKLHAAILAIAKGGEA